MRVLLKSDPRTISLYSDTCTLLFRQLPRKSKEEGPTVGVEIVSNEQITKQAGFKTLLQREVSGCLGLITVDESIYLVVITGALKEVAKPVKYETIDKIYSVEFVSLSSDEWDFVNLDANGAPMQNSNTQGDVDENGEYYRTIHPCSELRKLLSNGSFYYSNDFDLTSLLQDRDISSEKLRNRKVIQPKKIDIDRYSKDYMWNLFLIEELIAFRSNLDDTVQALLDDNKFLTIVIRGYANSIRLNQLDSLTIISKQSWKRAGTRYNARGIDDNGDVANFVETEVIYSCLSKGQISAFTQIRGSVPAFWEQDSTLINPKITLTRSIEATQPVFNKHFRDIQTKYESCHIVNLLSRTKPAEASLSRRYRELYNNYDRKSEIPFTDFDFHYETKQSGGFAGAAKVLPLLENTLEQIGWFTFDVESSEIITRQNGVFRVNCLDCLDRTNLVQQLISQDILRHNLMNLNTSDEGYRQRIMIDDIINKHNTAWADNGDAISQIYTGTNALKSSFTRSGKMNFAGALSDVTKSVSRMYQNTFVDGKKQSTIELLLGYDAKYSKSVRIYDPINEFVQKQLHENSGIFTSWEDIKMFVGTFNVSSAPANRNVDLISWLFPDQVAGESLPDIYAIGIQELIELNAGSILTADNSKSSQWARLIEDQLNSQNESYLLLRTEALASLSLFLFVKKSQISKVTQVSGSSRKTGLGGIAANKGASAVRFNFGSTSIALVTSHLAAGANALIERNNEYQSIMQGLKFTRNFTLSDHDHIIWFGDLNYRITLANDRCRSLIDQGAYNELLQNDQLNQEFAKKGAFYEFREGKIAFPPTYKFDKGTSSYDTSEKQRIPSWTDRILYMSSKDLEKLRQLSYNSLMDISVSDHKPVFATFGCHAKFIDEEKRRNLAKITYDKYKTEHQGSQNNDSLLDFSTPKQKRASNGSSFTVDTLTEMSLIDELDSSSPRLPPRPSTNSPLPKRIPPPTTRRVPPDEDLGNNDMSGSQSDSGSKVPPLPPPRKTTGSTSSVASSSNPPLGFSFAPLVPSRSNSSTPNLTTNDKSITLPPPSEAKKPLVPSKPASLSSNKTEHLNPPAVKEDSVTSEKRSSLAPPPPPSRSTGGDFSNQPTGQRTMADWTPLVPK